MNPARIGTKATARYVLDIPARGRATVRLRLTADTGGRAAAAPLGPDFDAVFEARLREADAFYEERIPLELTDDERLVSRQAYAGLHQALCNRYQAEGDVSPFIDVLRRMSGGDAAAEEEFLALWSGFLASHKF